MNVQTTPNVNQKKRELSSPEFEIDTKKNKQHLSASSESDLDISDISVTALDTIKESTESTETIESSDMASNISTATPSPVTEITATPSPVTETTETTESAATQHLMIPPSEMLKISELLKETFRGEIVGIVDSVVKGVLGGLNERISSLEKENVELKQQNQALSSRILSLEKAVDQGEQYSRRNCLRITGVPEEATENTDEIVLKLASDLGTDIQLSDVDRSHRLGRFDSARARPRDIIVKFATFRTRQKLYKVRSSLKDKGYNRVFLNEDLTKVRSKVLFDCRSIVKAKGAKGAWTSDGTILIRDLNDVVHRVTTAAELASINFPEAPPRL